MLLHQVVFCAVWQGSKFQIYPDNSYTQMSFKEDPNSRFIQSSAVHKDVVRWRSKFHPLPSLPSLPGIWDSSTHKKLLLWQIIWMLLDIPQSLYFLLLRKSHKSHSQAGLARDVMQFFESPTSAHSPQLRGFRDPSTHKHTRTLVTEFITRLKHVLILGTLGSTGHVLQSNNSSKTYFLLLGFVGYFMILKYQRKHATVFWIVKLLT